MDGIDTPPKKILDPQPTKINQDSNSEGKEQNFPLAYEDIHLEK